MVGFLFGFRDRTAVGSGVAYAWLIGVGFVCASYRVMERLSLICSGKLPCVTTFSPLPFYSINPPNKSVSIKASKFLNLPQSNPQHFEINNPNEYPSSSLNQMHLMHHVLMAITAKWVLFDLTLQF